MSLPVTHTPWIDANQHQLSLALAEVRRSLERYATEAGINLENVGEDESVGTEPSLAILESGAPEQSPEPESEVEASALAHLCEAFGLTDFERQILLLCAAVELDGGIAELVARIQRHRHRPHSLPDFSLSLAVFSDTHWSAIASAEPLRHWRLVELGQGECITTSPLRIDEHVLHFLAGVHHFDTRLTSTFDAVVSGSTLVPSHREVSEHLATIWQLTADGASSVPNILLLGDAEPADKREIASAACGLLGLNLFALSAHLVPSDPAAQEEMLRLWTRESALQGSALLLDCDRSGSIGAAQEATLARFIERCNTPLVISGGQHGFDARQPPITLVVRRPNTEERRDRWRAFLEHSPFDVEQDTDAFAMQFNLSDAHITAACTQAISNVDEASASPEELSATFSDSLWDACRSQARPRLDGLARSVTPIAGWDDLVLPPPQVSVLRDIAMHVRQRTKVYEEWGFQSRSSRGLGISALFTGDSGTGKTMAAEVLANTLRLDLYHIDLSQVVSKYIGETEKNLRRVFDAGEAGGAILLFDEADALFGKRSEVKDSHDRYANIEVSYLLQRMEEYRGLAILTTNRKSVLDSAFLRRIRFIVQFPFPDRTHRREIWQRIFPADTPKEGLEPDKLAALNVTGGNIRNIALFATFLAAEADEPVRMKHLERAARAEYAKLERTMTKTEIGGWT